MEPTRVPCESFRTSASRIVERNYRRGGPQMPSRALRRHSRTGLPLPRRRRRKGYGFGQAGSGSPSRSIQIDKKSQRPSCAFQRSLAPAQLSELKRREKCANTPALLWHRRYQRVAGRIDGAVKIVAGHALAAHGACAGCQLLVVQPDRRTLVNGQPDSAIQPGSLSRIGKPRYCQCEAQRKPKTAHKFLLQRETPLGKAPWGNSSLSHTRTGRARFHACNFGFCCTMATGCERHSVILRNATGSKAN